MKNWKKYTFGLGCQAHSHLELIGVIFCLIGFEIFKRENENNEYNLEEFTIPIDVDKLYESFNSLSYKARMAMESMHKYLSKKK